MTARIKFPIYLIIFIVVFLATGFSFIGQAFSPATVQERGGHALNDISGYNIQVNFKLNNKNPRHVSSVLLNVSAPNGVDTANTVHISLNDGETWAQCDFLWGQSWQCDFSTGSEPHVVDAEKLEVSAQGIKKTSGYTPILQIKTS